ncbi:MAG: PQQ-binding-like beta-propeller repeat protein [Solirubrobacteraceae bacterium]
MPPQERRRRWRRIVLALGVAMVLLVGAAAGFVLTQQEGDVSNPEVEFKAEPSATPDTEVEPRDPNAKQRASAVDRFIWSHYGYTRDRRRYLPLDDPPRPPFEEIWRFSGDVLLEFPPVIGGRRLYLLNDHGRLLAIDKHSGNVRWKRKLGALAAASPAYANGIVYVVLLQRTEEGAGSRVGRVVALDGATGKIRWSHPLASRSESSPLVADGRVYFGSENGTVYAMDADDGAVRWRIRAGGAVKGGLALSDGKLYFGDYGGRVYAIRESNGATVWRASTNGGRFGLGAGNFYSTPAVAYGRVYLGNTDGRIYSFSAGSGKLAWSKSTGGYVYASPAVAQVPGGRPLVYAGSYSGKFYALDARSGAVRWVRGGNGKISGGATVIGDIVYYADLGNRKTIGLGARTGRKVFEHERGSYNPVVSDGETIYLTGYHVLYALRPLSAATKKARAKSARARAERRRTDRRVCRKRAQDAHRGKPGAQRRSYRRCVTRRPELRRKRSRAECARVARRAHRGDKGAIRRSYERCVDRRHAHKRG